MYRITSQKYIRDANCSLKRDDRSYLNADALPRTEKVKNDPIEFFRLLHIRHVMSFRNQNPLRTDDFLFKCLCNAMEMKMIICTDDQQGWHMDICESFIGRRNKFLFWSWVQEIRE